ncbi:GTP pyrophosphokinase (plasmid) [Bacillus thuringiensis]|nr:GTP pyrophosphokinase [Bacillus thuringiensis]NVO39945.1 GTP pyrophosphokinase [Bacillus thuringiensis serovar israelensis]QKH16735.1 GTP pyrophosphokinase [Bacillus thuringiensis]QKH23006.1 GTP pyrophosphokinase [Bacillus thuringiensis]UEL07531.1 GTP pyrophosphokinase [Bacillus thuringiensis]UWX38932.1 GTP pyrophosphokinase [Bacillus thuringiensis]
MINKVEHFIYEINQLHKEVSQDYFETNKEERYNLSKTITHVPVDYILDYRLNLHECINDYLMRGLSPLFFVYRVKTHESIMDKLERYANRENKYPVNGWLNDIFGCRLIVDTETMELIENTLDKWKEQFNLKNWYKKDKDGYKAIHVYFKNQNNVYFPWELQIWDEKDKKQNIQAHRSQKRKFILNRKTMMAQWIRDY